MRKFPFAPIIFLAFFGWPLLQALISVYPTILWFDNLGYTSVFWTNLSAQALTGLVFGSLFFVIAAINIFIARRVTKDLVVEKRESSPAINIQKMIRELFGEQGGGASDSGMVNVTPQPVSAKNLNLLWGIGTLVISIFVGLSAVTQWQVVLKALNATAFGIVDPIFGRDIGFYVFSLPLHKFGQGFLFSAFLLPLFAVIWIYLTSNAISFSGLKLNCSQGVKTHLALLLAALAVIFAWGMWLGQLEILYSARGVVFGAGYTDVKAQLLAYNLQILLLIILAGLFLINIFQKDYRLPLTGLGAYLVVALFMGGIYPAIVQNLQVKPSEISLEAPYIKHGIKYTRMAYGLDEVEEKAFAADENLSLRDVQRNVLTIGNIRLWDPRPLIKTYRQLQGIRLYYDFSDVDIDRYQIDGKYQQVMLSVRELRVDKLPDKAQTWINQHLMFTHGYGLCLSPVNEQTPDGLPDLLVKNIPPETKTNLKIGWPQIYFGEETNNYVIVNTKEKEFDYPKGDSNVYASYAGNGGVQISSFLRKLAFAMKYSDMKILLTDYITNDSRIMFDRSIQARVKKIVPFLTYDRDPYVVISEGKLYWIQDAYTMSDLYPYSDPFNAQYGRFNYIRNSVKVVIDAYNGDVTYYMADEKDPIAQTYAKIYPNLFKPLTDMPEGLKKHLRYPYDLFMIQAHKYATFHMEDSQVFYNQEDLWNLPKEMYANSEQLMEAYYIIMKLPEEKREEFLLMLPFTPNDKDNMVSWLAARSDIPNYGKLIVYKFPKEKLVYGPKQIEARIDQQTEISQQFTLWGQIGSRVIRGNLLAIPIEQSILYIEPIYLEASSGELPELKRVIAAYGNKVVMAETLSAALSSVFSGRVSTASARRDDVPKYLNPKELAKKALDLYEQAQGKLKQGDFGTYGEKLGDLKKVLQDLAK
ncbi:hypothetical protein A3H38_06580 [candidate division WOR-1 bacterium RIFCSPLOWO2_02_FULL_46_20]|uniref:UPF0182 protein A3H38_06580 n=1 Tax=candidate division WOR-1 bacterium RIFCSPLOWO2_02_FULL_46_20 TaxID=1802567 RepID=A0A1F4RCF4_UNCSA|nr:MAG: hypothetical protein A3H38_06580 [candidate division WOR-1 bacterium RIFCSPLOWO2_02_FULL_46_20]